jgi:hypothetical protein
MVMRHWAMLVCAAVLCCAAPAQAQISAAPTPVAADQDQTASGMQKVFGLFLYDSGLFDRMLQEQVPGFRQSLTDTFSYHAANAAHRAALMNFAGTLPTMMHEELDLLAPAIAANAARRLDGDVSAEDLNAFVAFMSRPDMRPVMLNFVDRYIGHSSGAGLSAPPMTDAQRAAFNEFAASDAGHAFVSHANEIFSALVTELEATTPLLVQRLATRMRVGMCTALGSECRDRGGMNET